MPLGCQVPPFFCNSFTCFYLFIYLTLFTSFLSLSVTYEIKPTYPVLYAHVKVSGLSHRTVDSPHRSPVLIRSVFTLEKWRTSYSLRPYVPSHHRLFLSRNTRFPLSNIGFPLPFMITEVPNLNLDIPT